MCLVALACRVRRFWLLMDGSPRLKNRLSMTLEAGGWFYVRFQVMILVYSPDLVRHHANGSQTRR